MSIIKSAIYNEFNSHAKPTIETLFDKTEIKYRSATSHDQYDIDFTNKEKMLEVGKKLHSKSFFHKLQHCILVIFAAEEMPNFIGQFARKALINDAITTLTRSYTPSPENAWQVTPKYDEEHKLCGILVKKTHKEVDESKNTAPMIVIKETEHE